MRGSQIGTQLGVRAKFDVSHEINMRERFLSDYLKASASHTLVLGISGGIDSLTAGLLAQRACIKLRGEGAKAEFIALRLPYGTQADESDAQECLAVIDPDRTLTINIKSAADAMFNEVADAIGQNRRDFHLGNIKARQRMIAHYAIAGATAGLVIGTDHAAEAVMGFFTKFGDGAADLLPLAGLNKRRVRALAVALGAPKHLVSKIPTADLESDQPLRPDEEAYGVTYDEIDNFLEGREVNDQSAERILGAFHRSAHKRALPIAPALQSGD